MALKKNCVWLTAHFYINNNAFSAGGLHSDKYMLTINEQMSTFWNSSRHLGKQWLFFKRGKIKAHWRFAVCYARSLANPHLDSHSLCQWSSQHVFHSTIYQAACLLHVSLPLDTVQPNLLPQMSLPDLTAKRKVKKNLKVAYCMFISNKCLCHTAWRCSLQKAIALKA